MDFDPYAQWLQIAAGNRPPNYYELLGLPSFTDDEEAIRAAGMQRSGHVRKFCLGQHGEEANRILGEVAGAMVCLADPARRREYDRGLRGAATVASPESGGYTLADAPPPVQVDRSTQAPADKAEPPSGDLPPVQMGVAQTVAEATVTSATVVEDSSRRPATPTGVGGAARRSATRRVQGVWALDIGNFAFKALRVVRPQLNKNVEVTAAELVEYRIPLSQPEADREALIRDALTRFTASHDLAGERVVVALPGAISLLRTIKLPPVDASTIADIIKYEAKSQIPFPLDEVVWDYQQVQPVDAANIEVHLAAVRREMLNGVLQPLRAAGIEPEVVQIAPVALFNLAARDQWTAEGGQADRWQVLIDIGADASEMVITNGRRLWRRAIPLGGNHFTRAVSKALKLTFAKAEHLKRNATQADDPKAVFQAIRPVLNDFCTETQRSIGFFASQDRQARIGKVLLMGGGVRLAGLAKYLSQNLGQDVEVLESFQTIAIQAGVDARFAGHAPEWAVCAGLALQGTSLAPLAINLLPPELKQKQQIRRSLRSAKPWLVAAAAMLLISALLWRPWSGEPDTSTAAAPAGEPVPPTPQSMAGVGSPSPASAALSGEAAPTVGLGRASGAASPAAPGAMGSGFGGAGFRPTSESFPGAAPQSPGNPGAAGASPPSTPVADSAPDVAATPDDSGEVDPFAEPLGTTTPPGDGSSDASSAPAPSASAQAKRGWGPEQATGAPDTLAHGDAQTAWASASADGQPEWLLVTFPKAVVAQRLDIYESFNPGAIYLVTVFTADKQERVVWQSTGASPEAAELRALSVDLPLGLAPIHQARVYLDSQTVRGWNEIDAVGLVDDQGQTHWASAAYASSNYANQTERPPRRVPQPIATPQGLNDGLAGGGGMGDGGFGPGGFAPGEGQPGMEQGFDGLPPGDGDPYGAAAMDDDDESMEDYYGRDDPFGDEEPGTARKKKSSRQTSRAELREQKAQQEFDRATEHLNNGKTSVALGLFRKIVRNYRGTQAAQSASAQLEQFAD